jgi:hypothetical protein
MPNYLRKNTNLKIEAKKILILVCSAQTWTRIVLLEKPPAVNRFPAVESHLGIRASYATRRKRRYEANKCGWTQPLFRKARDRGVN